MSGQMLADTCEPAFARHETFHPRFGWLRKAVDRAGDGTTFTHDDATVTFGVGKNMVTAIRYWGLAFKVLQKQQDTARPRVPLVLPSPFGIALLSDDGWDPYLEDPASLWLLHWKLLSGPGTAPTWWVAFNDFTPLQFTEQQLTARVVELAAAAGWPSVVDASVKKDVDCLIRTYTVRRHGRQALDDVLDCPFRELGLLTSTLGDEGRTWRFVVGEKPTLPDAIIVYAALDFASREASSQSMSIARLTHDPGSPGLAFRLTESVIFDALSRFSAAADGLEVAEPSGQRQLLFRGVPAEMAEQVLSDYYRASGLQEVRSA